jgi:2-iminobutanoate/2-iminopropanoate deaminase
MDHPTAVTVPGLPPANATFEQAVQWRNTLYVSGQIGLNPETGELAPGGQIAEYRQALNNLKAILEAAGTSMARVVKTTIYMTDISELGELNKVYSEFFQGARPAKTGVEVSRLALGALIEIEAVAAL